MSRESWGLIKAHKNFNIHMYRRGISLLIISLTASALLSSAIIYIYLHEPERDYYATSGITAPIKLTARLEANNTSIPLLDADPVVDDEIKVIPQ